MRELLVPGTHLSSVTSGPSLLSWVMTAAADGSSPGPGPFRAWGLPHRASQGGRGGSMCTEFAVIPKGPPGRPASPAPSLAEETH